MNNRFTRWLQMKLGGRALAAGKFSIAIYHYDRLYRMAKQNAGTHNLVTAEAAIKLSNALVRTQLPDDLNLAAKLMNETIETTSRLLPKSDFRHAVIDALMGEIALRKRNYLVARELLQRAVDVFDKTPAISAHREILVLELLEQTCKEAGWTEQESAVRRRINAIAVAQLITVDPELMN